MKTHIYDVIFPTLMLVGVFLIYLGLMLQVNSLELLIGFSLAFLTNHLLFRKFMNTDELTEYVMLYFFALFLAFLTLSLCFEFFEKYDNVLFYSFSILLGTLSVAGEAFLVTKKTKREIDENEKVNNFIEA